MVTIVPGAGNLINLSLKSVDCDQCVTAKIQNKESGAFVD